MPRVGVFRSTVGGLIGVLVSLLSASPSAAPAALLQEKAAGPLAPTLAELAKPALRSLSPGRQARALGLAPHGPGSLLRRGDEILVRVRFDHGALASRDSVRMAGAQLLGASRRYQSATAAVAPADLRKLAALPTVASISPIRTPMLFAPNCEGGSVISEGVAQLHAKSARESFSVDGAGTKVGVLSDSYDQASEAITGGEIETHAAEDIETADLPGVGNSCTGQTLPTTVVQDFESGEATDEGRGMLQIVHDVAPKATLAFATAFEGEEGFAKNIKALALLGAKVIVDDVGYFEEPFFQDGPIGSAINEVTGAGVTYLSAAGNDNLVDGEANEFASWEAPEYRDTGSCPAAVASLGAEFNPSHCMDFNPSAATDRTYGIKVEPEEVLTVDLQWAEPWEGVESDIDAFLLNKSGSRVLTGAVEANEETQRPVEILQWVNESGSAQTVQLAINLFSGPGARLKLILLENGGGVSGVEYPRSGGGDVVGPTIFGHAGAASAIAVGAVRYEPRPGEPFGPEPYSSRGPVTHYFEAVEGAGPASPIPGGEVISKPDVAATDCGGTTFFAVFAGSEWHFCGTSAAAPHAAGVVSLMRESEPLAGPGEAREALLGSADPIPPFGPCALGGGLVEAVGAVEAIGGSAVGTPEACEPPASGGAVFVSPGEWGTEQPPPTAPASSAQEAPQPTPVAPRTRFAKHPPKVVRTARKSVRLVFRFRSNQTGIVFLCKVDRSRFRACGARLARRFKLGRHLVKVKARGSTGLVDPTPAVFRFRVVRR
jgi:hypothetical protein